MIGQYQVARDITYAGSAETRFGRMVIRLMENASGRRGLIRRAAGYDRDVAGGQDFWQVMLDRFGLSLEVSGGSLGGIPKNGPLILVANHPYGILDGLILGHILRQLRGDFRILANAVFSNAPDLDNSLLPISFGRTREALQTNLTTRKAALRFLNEGGAIGVFPGGTVSTARTPLSRPMDPVWRSFTARMITKSGATVVPIYFDGQNSRLFQIASHLHVMLRMGLLIKEFRRRVDTPVRMVVGSPIPEARLSEFSADPKAMMDFLRKSTYDLSPTHLRSDVLGYEFEQHHRA